MRRWWCPRRKYAVDVEKAEKLFAMLRDSSRSFAGHRDAWVRAGIIVRRPDDDLEAIDDETLHEFFWELAAVRGDPQARKLRCICNVWRSTSECSHVCAIYEMEGVFHWTGRSWLPG